MFESVGESRRGRMGWTITVRILAAFENPSPS